MGTVSSPYECLGEHHFFVAETGVVEAEGKVCVVIVCTACGESKLIEHRVAGNVHIQKQKG